MRFDKPFGEQLWVDLVQQCSQRVHYIKDSDVFTRIRINDGGAENVVCRKGLRWEKKFDGVTDNDAVTCLAVTFHMHTPPVFPRFSPGSKQFLTFKASPTDVEVLIVIISLGFGGAFRETLPLWSS